MPKAIGTLQHNGKGFIVVCESCFPANRLTSPVFRENIGNYKQTCGVCHKVLVEGKTEAWPELYDGK
jgi:hypothetical protein